MEKHVYAHYENLKVKIATIYQTVLCGTCFRFK